VLLHSPTLGFSVAALAVAARVVFLVLLRTQVIGKTISHNYSPELLQRDKRFYLADLYQYKYGGRVPQRKISFLVEYSYDGRSYRNTVDKWVIEGNQPKSSISLWIDPHNPDNVTAQGPGYWFILLLVLALGAVLWRPAGNAILDKIFPTCTAAGQNCRTSADSLKPLGEDMFKHRHSSPF